MAVKKAGQIILFNFPQTDFANGKLRPALLLAKLPGSYDDWLICMISSQTDQYIEGLDDIIQPDAEDFAQSGLKTGSVFRVSRLAVAVEGIFEGVIGEISLDRLKQIRDNLANWIKSYYEPAKDNTFSNG